MIAIFRSFLLLLLLLPLYGAQEKMYINVGSFTTHERANDYSLVIQKAMEQDRDIVSLRISNGFRYGTQVYGYNHRTVIGPFTDLGVLKKVLKVAKQHAPDAFVSKDEPSKIMSKMKKAETESNLLLKVIIGIILILFFGIVYYTR